MYFQNYGLGKKWLDKSLKWTVSEHYLRDNKLKGQKYC